MFKFMSTISALNLLLRETGKFLGVGPHPGFGDSAIKIVDDISKAFNFRIRHGGINSTDNSENHFEKTPLSNTKIRIIDKTGTKSFEIDSGQVKDGNILKFNTSHNEISQQLNLRLLSNMAYTIYWEKKCIRYKKADNAFFTGTCENIGNDSFDIYVDNSPADDPKVEKEIYKLQDDANSLHDRDSIQYSSSGYLLMNSPKTKATKISNKDMGSSKNIREDGDSIHEYSEIMKDSDMMNGIHEDADGKGLGKGKGLRLGKRKGKGKWK